MPEPTTRRRWYQFRLSTVLVLVGIAAWVMALRPWYYVVYMGEFSSGYVAGTEPPAGAVYWSIAIMLSSGSLLAAHSLQVSFGPDPQLLGPLFALGAFLTWKWTWPCVVRGRARQRERALLSGERSQ